MPSSFSAPPISKIVRESVCEETANAIRDGILAFTMPVITSTEGRCVASIRCIPAALAFCARRRIASSTSTLATIIKSASSSIMITINGIFSSACSLKLLISRTWLSANALYLRSISATAQCRAEAAFLLSVTTGVKRCGMPL